MDVEVYAMTRCKCMPGQSGKHDIRSREWVGLTRFRCFDASTLADDGHPQPTDDNQYPPTPRQLSMPLSPQSLS